MQPIDRALHVPRFEVHIRDGHYTTHCCTSDAGFMRMFERDSIEAALTRYHIRFKSQYRTAVYVGEDWKQYWLEKVKEPLPDQPDFTISIRRPRGEYPDGLTWLR